MPNCTCASAHRARLSASSDTAFSSPSPASSASPGTFAPPASPAPTSATLRQQAESVCATLGGVRDYLALLGDCALANLDNTADIATESLAVALRCQVEQLDAAGLQIDALHSLAQALMAGAHLAGRIEAQGNAAWEVRHLLASLYDAFGHHTRTRHPVNAEAFAGVFARLAERLGQVERRVLELAFAPLPDRAPAAAATAPAAPAKSTAPARANRTQPEEATCA